MPLAKLALGIGLGAAAALAVKEARRFRAQGVDRARGREGKADQLGLGPREPAVAGIVRMTIAQLDFAILTLQSAPERDVDLAVHEARKAIKRVRTLQRLRKDGCSRTRRDHRKALLREAAAALSELRDTKVALDTLESLIRRDPQKLAASKGVARLRSTLLAEQDQARRALAHSGARERALLLLQATRAEATAEQPPVQAKRRDTRAVNAGLLRIYERGRGAMAVASRRRSIAEMHEWRKRVKDLRYAAEALAQSESASAKRRRQARLRKVARSADRLGEALGEEHDLALMATRVRAEDEIFRGDRAGRKALLRAIKRRRRRLRKRAFTAGSALYERGPKRWGKRLPSAR